MVEGVPPWRATPGCFEAGLPAFGHGGSQGSIHDTVVETQPGAVCYPARPPIECHHAQASELTRQLQGTYFGG